MPDIQYVFKAARRRGSAYAQRKSVLWPLMRRRSLLADTVIEDAEKLLSWWRAKANSLRTAGWKELTAPGALQFARNCPPTIAVAVGARQARPCGLTQICPWCYSRETEDLYNLLASFLPKRGATNKRPLRILEIASSRTLTPYETGTMLNGSLRAWKSIPQTIVRKQKPLGAYYGVELEPRIVNEQLVTWKFSFRILALFSPEWEPAESLLTNDLLKVRVSTVTSRKQLVPIVARTRRYPIGLMKGDENYVMRALNARRGLKCKALTGCLRGVTRSSQ